jgi:hypothetical protein
MGRRVRWFLECYLDDEIKSSHHFVAYRLRCANGPYESLAEKQRCLNGNRPATYYPDESQGVKLSPTVFQSLKLVKIAIVHRKPVSNSCLPHFAL